MAEPHIPRVDRCAKAQSDLILEAIKTGNPSKAATNLDFFVNLGFINDPEGRIKKYLVNTGDVPVLPPASGTASANTGIFKSVQTLKGERRALSNSVGKLNGVSDEGLVLSCTAWIIAKDLIITADYCVSGMKGGLTFVLGDAPGMSLSTHSVELPPAELDAHAGFALLKVENLGASGSLPLPLSQREPKVGELIFLLHYPAGGQQVISEDPKDCKIVSGAADSDEEFKHTCATVGGSSGAPIISATTLEVLGLHYGKTGSVGNWVNRGKRISAIIKRSQTLKRN